MWQDNADVEFLEAVTDKWDLEIRWESGEHGCPFDQGGGTVAHAFPTNTGMTYGFFKKYHMYNSRQPR